MQRCYKIAAVACCGGELQGNIIRWLINHGDETHNDITTHLINQNDHNEVGNLSDKLTNDKTKATC